MCLLLVILLHLRMRRLLLGSGHFVQNGVHLFLFVKGLPQVVQVENILGNFLDFVHVHVQLCKPGPAILVQDDARHVETRKSYQIGRVQKGHVGPQAVIDDSPSNWQHRVLNPQILAVLHQRPVGLENDQAAVHVFQEVKLALQNVIRPIWKILKKDRKAKFLMILGSALHIPGWGKHRRTCS